MPWPGNARAAVALVVLMLAYVVGFVDRQVLSLLVEPITTSLDLSETQFGLLQGFAFGTFYTVLGLPLARLVDRTDRRALLAAGVAFWSLMTAACGLARGFVELLLARMGVGVGEATLAPSAVSLIADFFPPHRRAMALSIYVSAGSVGGGLAFLLGGFAIEAVDRWDRSGMPWLAALEAWQVVFLLVASPGLLVSAALLLLREPLRHERAATGGDTSLFSAPLRAFLRSHSALFLAHFTGFALFALMSYGVLSWVAAYFIRSFGWSAAQFGYAFGWAFLVGGAGGAVSGGVLATWARARRWRAPNLTIAALGVTAAAPVALAACLVPDANLALLLFGLSLFLMALPSGPSIAALQEVTPNEFRGRVSALYYLAMNLVGLGVGALAVGLVSDYWLRTDQQVGLAMAIVTALSTPPAILCLWLARGFRVRAERERRILQEKAA